MVGISKNNIFYAVTVLTINIVVLLVGVVYLQIEPHIPILINIGIVMLYGKILGLDWDTLIAGMQKTVSESVGVFIVILMVGVVVGTWTMCGTVPAIIYYGLVIFSPKWFLLSVLWICFLMAFVTGSSWTTAGTIGVAFMGVGISLGIPVGLTAGCIISGAMCGDKQSPLGAATNLAAEISKTDLYEELRALSYISIPSMLGCSIAFLLFGRKYAEIAVDTSQVKGIMEGLSHDFRLSPILFVPIILLLLMIMKKIPTVPTLIVASLCAVALSVTVQGNTLSASLQAIYGGYVSSTGIELLDTLLTRGGIVSMGSTILLIILALALAGCLEVTGVMSCIMVKIGGILHGRFSLITTAYAASGLLGMFSSDCHMAIVLTANALKERFDALKIHRSILARTIHDAATGLSPLVPWGTAGVYFSAALNVPVSKYAPYYILAFVMTACTLLFAATGYSIRKSEE